MSTLCRNCAYYKNKPHKIIWEFTNEIEEYDGICIAPDRHPNMEKTSTMAGCSCFHFKKKVTIGPVLGAYNKGGCKNGS